MNAIERAVGVWLHRVIVRHPLAHAELLNQYRSSEDFGRRFPKTLCAALLDDGPLKAKYRKHQADEERHERTYAARIRALGAEPHEVGDARDYMLTVWREAIAAGVGIPYARFAESRPLDRSERMRLWALQTAVEDRGLEELALHRVACEREGNAAMLEILDAIEPDERHHAEYSRRALEAASSEACGSGDESMGHEHVSVLEAMKRAEGRAYLRVTGPFLRDLMEGPLASAGWAARAALQVIAATTPGYPARPASQAW